MTITMAQTKKITKYVAGLMAASIMSLPSYASAEGLNLIINRDRDEAKVGAMFSIPIPFFGEGKNTKYNQRNQTLESQIAGLTQVPAFNSESSSQPYFEQYDGNWFTKPLKELGHGMTTPLHAYNTKTDGTTRWLPGYSTITKEGSIAAPIYGIFASAINGTAKLFGSNYRVNNPFQANFWRTMGTALMEIGAGIAVGSSGGGGGSSSSSTTTTTPPAEEEELPPAAGGDI
ncbi:MAG: hypothetical protein KJ646_03875 [Nanoarchaeota archaeon]|nr:hypothetical protein [Nanoarchaeota archaeon]